MTTVSTLVVVDGHNMISDLGRQLSKADEPWWTGLDAAIRRRYYREWFDVDRLVEATIGRGMDPWRDLGIVVFHSNKAVGDRATECHIEGREDLAAFWARQGANANTATHLVEVQGAPSGKDAGMDTAIVVYMFETAERWDASVLFTNDADFVPAVWALRRKGKRVFCAAPVGDRDAPVVRACQHFYHWNPGLLCADRMLFECTQREGTLDQVLALDRLRQQGFLVSLAASRLLVCGPPGTLDGSAENRINEILRRSGLHAVDAGSIDYGEGTKVAYVVEPLQDPALSAWTIALRGGERHVRAVCDGAGWLTRARIS